MSPMSLRHGCVLGIKRATNLARCHGNCVSLKVAVALKCVFSRVECVCVEALVSEYEAGVGECDSGRLEIKITELLNICVLDRPKALYSMFFNHLFKLFLCGGWRGFGRSCDLMQHFSLN